MSTMEFICCSQSNDDGGSELVCCKCSANYHFACIFPNKDENWIPDQNSCSSWLCPTCSRGALRDNRDETPVRSNPKAKERAQDSSCYQNVTLRKNSVAKNEDLISISKETLRNIIKEEINEAFTSINSTLKDLRTEFADLQKSVKFMSEKYDTITKRIAFVEEKTKTVNALELEITDLKNQLKVININIDKQEQWGRRSNIEIIGLPEKNGENLIHIVSKLASHAKCPLDPQTDIDFVTRVAHMNKDVKKPKPIIVRFLARYKKDDFLARLREIKDLKACDIGYADNASRIYCNEHLTSYKKSLLNKVKKVAEEKHYKYVWVKNYTILARKSDPSSAINISSEEDLKKLV